MGSRVVWALRIALLCVCVLCVFVGVWVGVGVCLGVCVWGGVCVEESRGKSKYTTCTKYTIFGVTPGPPWVPLNLKKSNKRTGIAVR